MQTNEWSRRDVLLCSTWLAAAGLAAPIISSCARTSSSGGSGTNLLGSLKNQGFVNVGVANGIPLGYKDRSGRVTGESPEVARAVFTRMGVPEIRPTQVAFDQLIPALNAGQFDMVCAGMYITPARCANTLFSRPDYTALEGLLVPRGNSQDASTLDDVAKKGVKLAVLSGSAERNYALAAGVNAGQIVSFDSNQAMFQAVASGRAYAAVLPRFDWPPLVQENAGAPVDIGPGFQPIVNGKPVVSAGGFVFRQNEQELVDAFNRELGAIHDNGEWLGIVKPFGLMEENLPPRGLTTEQLCSAT